MHFVSLKYLLFFIAVVSVFFAIPQRFRWMFLLATSYFFYMTWDPKYALLLLTTTTIVYGTGLLMQDRPQNQKKTLAAFSLVANLGVLFAFKYYNFFNNSIKDLFGLFGTTYDVPAMTLLMPVGISFYTFQALSYTIDVYRGTRKAERNFGMFALYVSFFPVILSGPIERSTTLLPQFYEKTEFNYDRVVNGLLLMAWGFFQKLVIADRLNAYTSLVYGSIGVSYGEFGALKGLPLLAAAYLYPIQIFCDFSGYTDIAIGTAQVMGYKLLPNFRRPFLSVSIGELWRRWHMSLISWIRDYLYIPLGGSRVSRLRWYFNLVFVFTMSGLWHGAQWTFVTWGAMNGAMIAVSRRTQTIRERVRDAIFGAMGAVPAGAFFALCAAMALIAALGGRAGIAGIGGRAAAGAGVLLFLALGIMKKRGAPYLAFILKLKRFWLMFATFNLFAFGGVFFRAKSMSDAWYILTHFLGTNVLHLFIAVKPLDFLIMLLLIVFLLVIHNIQEKRGSIRAIIRSKPFPVRWAFYYLLVMSIFAGMRQTGGFEYFRF